METSIEKPNPDSNLAKLEALLRSGKVQEALNYSQELMRSYSSSPEYLVLRGRCIFLNGSAENAKKLFMEALRLDPDFSKAKDQVKLIRAIERTKEEGNKAFTSGNAREAIECYSRALQMDPQNQNYNSVLLANRAAAYMKLKDYMKALEDLNKAISYSPNYTKAYMRRGNVRMQMEEYDEALKDYNEVKNRDPNHPEVDNCIRLAQDKSRRASKKDYYKILGVDKSASDSEIKKAYRKLALKWHPDKHSGTPEEKARAEKIFKDINEAYGVLSDQQKRQRYDMGVDEEGMGGFDMGGGIDPMQMFQMFFGGDPFQQGGFAQSEFPSGFPSGLSGFSRGGFPGNVSFTFRRG